jgi:winged helix-turn-helix protein/methyltransferase family protein
MSATTLDPERLDAFLGRFVLDAGAAMATPNIIVGDRLGLYRALADTMPATPAQVAAKAGCDERYVREWLCGQAAGGYVEYDRDGGRFSMTPEQVACLADESSPTFVAGAFEIAGSVCRDIDRLADAVRNGDGVGWHEHDPALFHGTDRFFRPGYVAHLLTEWLPALDDVIAKLEAGARVADVGCGLGASTILMAQAFPRSSITGFDYHDASIAAARSAAGRAKAGATFEVPRLRPSRGRATTSSACSTACTTWATRSAPRGTSAARWPTTGRGCWSSRWPATGWRTTSTRSGGSSTAPRR